MKRNVPLARVPFVRKPPEPGKSRRNSPLRAVSTGRARESGRPKSAATTWAPATSGRSESFPPAVAALIDARDPWCIHCGSVDALHRHHRQIKGIGGDGRDHTQCSCNGLRLCWLCHSWAHSGNGQREAKAEGLIISRFTLEPFAADVLVHLCGDVGGQRKWPSCDGRWLDYMPESEAA